MFLDDRVTHVTCLPAGVSPRIPDATPRIPRPRPTLHSGSFVAFDTETTGIGVNDRIVSAAIIQFVNGVPVNTVDILINPGIAIPAAASAIHGITTAHARKHGVCEVDGLAAIREALDGRVVVAYNASFDMRMLRQRLDAHAREMPDCEVYDAYAWCREDKAVGPHRLQHACEFYGVDLTDWHTAAADAMAAGLVALAQCRPLAAAA